MKIVDVWLKAEVEGGVSEVVGGGYSKLLSLESSRKLLSVLLFWLWFYC